MKKCKTHMTMWISNYKLAQLIKCGWDTRHMDSLSSSDEEEIWLGSHASICRAEQWDFPTFKRTLQYNTIWYNTNNLYSTGIPGVAMHVHRCFKPKSIRQKTYLQRKTIFIIQRSRSLLTMEDFINILTQAMHNIPEDKRSFNYQLLGAIKS